MRWSRHASGKADGFAKLDAQDQMDKQREERITTIEGKLEQRISNVPLFSIRWRLYGAHRARLQDSAD